jgi:hypothetical protein
MESSHLCGSRGEMNSTSESNSEKVGGRGWGWSREREGGRVRSRPGIESALPDWHPFSFLFLTLVEYLLSRSHPILAMGNIVDLRN